MHRFGSSCIKMSADSVKEGIDAICPFIANLENSHKPNVR